MVLHELKKVDCRHQLFLKLTPYFVRTPCVLLVSVATGVKVLPSFLELFLSDAAISVIAGVVPCL